MNYATNRKMLVTMELEAIVLHLSSLFVFPLLQDKDKGGREEEENEKKARAMICSDPVTRFSSFRWIDRGDLTAIGYTPRQNLLLLLLLLLLDLIRTEWS